MQKPTLSKGILIRVDGPLASAIIAEMARTGETQTDGLRKGAARHPGRTPHHTATRRRIRGLLSSW